MTMISEKKRPWPNLWYYPSIPLGGLTTKTLSNESLSPDRDLNPGLVMQLSGVVVGVNFRPV
jgi:hypothetical protein